MRETSLDRISSFTVGYPGVTSQAEMVQASRVAELLNLDHHELQLIAPTSLDLIELTWFLDFPVFSPSALASSLVSGLAREHVATMFCCQGAHRLFADPIASLDDGSRSLFGLLRETGLAALHAVGLSRGSNASWAGCQAGAGLPDRRSRWKLYSEAFRQELQRGKSGRASNGLQDEWATRMDRVASAHGMRLCSPYQDPALVHWSQSLVARGLTPKGGQDLLREAASGLLPAWALEGVGSGFYLPIREWLVGPLASFTEALLSPTYLAHQGLFCPTTVGKLLADHESLAVDRSRELWSLLTFQLWYLTFIEDEELATNEIGRAREKDRLPMRPPVRVAPLPGYV
jgi:asparagine synthase (glutamine-hydrolysing)